MEAQMNLLAELNACGVVGAMWWMLVLMGLAGIVGKVR
jgi:hypothetical protein